MTIRRLILLAFLLLDRPAWAAEKPPSSPSFEGQVQPVVAEYCVSCHGPEKKKGDLDLSVFKTSAKAAAAKEIWQNVASRLRDGDMPPKKAKHQPTAEERKAVLAWVEKAVGKAQVDCSKIASDETQKGYKGHVLSRRLTRGEYGNTVRDLFGVELHAAEGLPEEGSGGEGFDTVGDTQFTSAISVEKYLQSADLIVMAVLPDSKDLASPEMKAARDRLLSVAPGAGVSPRDAARKDLTVFVGRAFRRPADAGEVDRLLALFDRGQAHGDSFDISMRLPVKAVLVSPNFLFLAEPEPPEAGVHPLGDYPLASRLSYFLWSSMPDEELFKLAAEHRLNDRKCCASRSGGCSRTRGRAPSATTSPASGSASRRSAGQPAPTPSGSPISPTTWRPTCARKPPCSSARSCAKTAGSATCSTPTTPT